MLARASFDSHPLLGSIIILSCCILSCSSTCTRNADCPAKCLCKELGRGITVDCQGRHLQVIPQKIPDRTVELVLKGNNITHIAADDFQGCDSLERLDLSDNFISIIEQNAFRSLVNLKELKLRHSVHFYRYMKLVENLFSPLRNLESIDIRENLFDARFSIDILSEIIWQLPVTLKSLDTDVPDDLGIASLLVNFTELGELGIYSKPTRPTVITNDTFKLLSNIPIKTLIIRVYNLRKVEPSAFIWFPQLETLDMSSTKGLSIVDLQPAWYGLQHTQLEVLNLGFVGKSSRPGRPSYTLTKSFFENFNFPRLTQLSLEFTGIEGADSWEFSTRVKNLEHLSLRDNRLNLTEIHKLFRKDLQHLQNLTHVDLSKQTPKRTDIRNTYFLTVNLPPRLKVLSLNMTPVWPSTGEHVMGLNMSNSNQLQQLYFAYNSLDMLKKPLLHAPNPEVPFDAHFNHNRLRSLSFFDESIRKGLRVRLLHVQNNQLGETLNNGQSQNMFEKFTCLEELHLESNHMKILPDDVFQNQSKLETLFLGFNDIVDLSTSIFKNQEKLKILNLRKNNIWRIQFEFSHMTNLRYLDVSYNSIGQLSKETLRKFDDLLPTSPNFTLNLEGNPLECSCNTLHFMHWMNRRHQMLFNFHTYTCIYEEKMVGLNKLETLIGELDLQCSMNLALKISSGLLAFVILITCASVLLYRHRWDVRFMCIKFVAKRNVYIEQEGRHRAYEYDAFVAYHESDSDWVREELYKHLDERNDELEPRDVQEPRFKLCIHDQDFIPGFTIEGNIIRAIENSRKTILVLSQKFLTSGWCEFELQMARMESFETGRHLIIAVMLEPLKIENMSKSLRVLIRNNTYIEWVGDSTCSRDLFWERLRFALNPEE